MNDVHLKIHQFSINGVFSWGMEMELLGEKICLRDMLVEQPNCSCAQIVERGEVVSWLLGLLDWEEVRLDGLVELV